LINAWRGKDGERLLELMDSNDRTFVSCQLVRLEIMPKPAFYKNALEVEFYNQHFTRVSEEEPLSETLANEALALASRYGLAAADAINLAAAIRLRARQFCTTELPSRPMFRVQEIEVVAVP
jgi:predicted nucleic acid-binding protein